MRKNDKKLVLLFFMVLTLLSGCAENQSQEELQPVEIPVKIMHIVEKNEDDIVSYVGVIHNDQMVKKAFKVQGRILELTVDEGDFVKAGDPLATLEPLDLDFALQAAEADAISARAQLTKANDALEYAKNTVGDSKILYEQGAVSKQSYDQSVLSLDLAQSDYNSALELSRQANVALDQKKNLKSESVMYAPFDGQVISVLVEEGEMISAGYPALVISTDKKIVYTGVSQRDVQRIMAGMPATVSIDDMVLSGVVRSVNQVPDSQTRTYQVAINIPDSTIPIGAVGDVKIVVGQITGVRIPIQSVLSSSVDYVFVVENGQAVKRLLKLGDMRGTDVFVTGLNAGEQLVVEGMKNLKNLSVVQIIED